MAKELNLFLTALLLYSAQCGKSHIKNQTIEPVYCKEESNLDLTKKVSIYDIKSSSYGILETEIMAGCYAGIVFSLKDNKPFAVLSHYPPKQIATHLNALKKERDFWLQLHNYDKAILIALMKNNSDSEYIKNFIKFYKGFQELFPDAKIFGFKYKLGDKIKIDLDYGICKVGEHSINILELLQKD